jgi:hypothetical protein
MSSVRMLIHQAIPPLQEVVQMRLYNMHTFTSGSLMQHYICDIFTDFTF